MEFKGTFVVRSPRHGQGVDVWQPVSQCPLRLEIDGKVVVEGFMYGSEFTAIWQASDEHKTVSSGTGFVLEEQGGSE